MCAGSLDSRVPEEQSILQWNLEKKSYSSWLCAFMCCRSRFSCSQMLFVFDRDVSLEEEAAIIKAEVGEVLERDEGPVCDTGITPPTAHILTRRFDRTNKVRAFTECGPAVCVCVCE